MRRGRLRKLLAPLGIPVVEEGVIADMNIDIQTFTINGTWTKPANALWCEILIVDGGTGGDGGGYDSGAKIGNGGSQGYGALFKVGAHALPATMAVTVGAGGAGGAGAVGDSPGTGVAGGASSFGNVLRSTTIGIYPATFLGDSLNDASWASAGGTGGDIDAAGGNANPALSAWTAISFAAGGTGGAAGVNGTNGVAGTVLGGSGGGGGGGAVTATSKGGNGGNGAIYGGGGGGGGSGDGTFSGGDGGDGADGIVVVWTITG